MGGQPWGQPVSDEHGANGAIWWTSRSLIFWAGRKKQEYNAKAFADGLQASNMLGIKRNKVMLPDVLNFAVEGEFAFDLGEGGSHVFQDMRFGQDNNDRWWMGGPTCTNTNGGLEVHDHRGQGLPILVEKRLGVPGCSRLGDGTGALQDNDLCFLSASATLCSGSSARNLHASIPTERISRCTTGDFEPLHYSTRDGPRARARATRVGRRH